ncbi:hypothetical protein F4805DRAFT_178775 [Annulohypoxylon moriforme]|nr:hypothetical protein F4805DRAFT_178775 [Annulohypoxylon moriforme]
MAAYQDGTALRNLKAELPETIRILPSQSEDFGKAIQKWISSARDIPGQTGELIYLLESSHSDLSTESLIEADLARFRHLQSFESRYRFNVFIVQVEKQDIGQTYDDYGYGCFERDESEDEDDASQFSSHSTAIDETDWTLRVALFDGDISRKPYNLNMDPDSLLQGDVFVGAAPDDEEGLPDDFRDSEHPNWRGFARYYRSLALLIVPQATTVAYFTDSLKDRDDYTAADLLDYFSSKCTEHADDDGVLKTLTSFCEIFFPPKDVKSNSRMDIPEPVIVKILETAIIRQSKSLFNLVWNNNETDLSPKFFSWILARLRESLMLPLTTLIPVLDRNVFAQKTLEKQYGYVMGLNDPSGKPPNELKAHVLDLFNKMVDLCCKSTLHEQDGKVLVWIACHRDYDWLLKILDPLISRERENLAFISGFCWELYAKATRDELRVPDSFDWLKTVLRSLIALLDVSRLVSVQGFQCWQQDRVKFGEEYEKTTPRPPPPITSQTLINLCVLLLDLGMEEDLRDLARRLADQCERIYPFELVNLYVPFIGNLIDVLENRSIDLGDPVLSSLVRTILLAFWNRHVIPGLPVWEEPRYEFLERCGCGSCRSMKNDFSFERRNWGIKESDNKSKKHIEQALKDLARHSHCTYSRTNGKKFTSWTLQTRTAMVGPSTITQASPPARTIPPPSNLRGEALSHETLQPLVRDGLPSVSETQHIPIYQDELLNPLKSYGLSLQTPAANSWPSDMPPPVAHSATPVQMPTLASAYGLNGGAQVNQQVQMPESQVLPARPPLASFPQNLTWSPGPKPEEAFVSSLKRKLDDDIIFVGERLVKR